MKTNMDNLLKEALEPVIEPEESLNKAILEKVATKKRKPSIKKYAGMAAAIAICVAIVTPGIYVGAKALKQALVKGNSISVGNPDYVPDEDVDLFEYEDVPDETLEEATPGPNDKWIKKVVKELNQSTLNTFYYYSSESPTAYYDAVADANFEPIILGNYDPIEDVSYCIVETSDTTYEIIDAIFAFGDGQFYVSQDYSYGNVAEDMAYIYPLHNPTNEREYNGFVLVDDNFTQNGEEKSITCVVYHIGKYRGHINFEKLTEEEIHQVLDNININLEPAEETTEETTETVTEAAE